MSLEFKLASGNAHKAEEFSDLFDEKIIQISPAPEKVEVVEDGLTFHENALKKAEGYFEKFKTPVMADDSGLIVNALPDELGIHTARFGGDGLSAMERNNLLLQRLSEMDGPDRTAAFVCVLCFYFGPEEVFFFEGRLEGEISLQPQGDEGFGYDPVFLPTKLEGGKSLAEDPAWKNQNSHRALACQHAQQFFKERVGQN